MRITNPKQWLIKPLICMRSNPVVFCWRGLRNVRFRILINHAKLHLLIKIQASKTNNWPRSEGVKCNLRCRRLFSALFLHLICNSFSGYFIQKVIFYVQIFFVRATILTTQCMMEPILFGFQNKICNITTTKGQGFYINLFSNK